MPKCQKARGFQVIAARFSQRQPSTILAKTQGTRKSVEVGRSMVGIRKLAWTGSAHKSQSQTLQQQHPRQAQSGLRSHHADRVGRVARRSPGEEFLRRPRPDRAPRAGNGTEHAGHPAHDDCVTPVDDLRNTRCKILYETEVQPLKRRPAKYKARRSNVDMRCTSSMERGILARPGKRDKEQCRMPGAEQAWVARRALQPKPSLEPRGSGYIALVSI